MPVRAVNVFARWTSVTELVPSTYWQKLKRHPGAPLVIWLAVLAFIAAFPDWRRGLIGAGLMLVTFGSMVLWTARTQP